MRLAKLLFKPKWQDKNANVRRDAVASARDAELIEALPQLLREDADAGVRLAALKRLNDYENWRERSTADADKGVRDAARSAYLGLLCAAGEQPTLKRRIAELETLSPDEIERVATTAQTRELRAAALERVTRVSLLVDRAVNDADAQLRIAALARVGDVNLLERIAERARKTDKTVARLARERIEAVRISGGDSTAIAERARLLCERMDALMRRPNADLTAELGAIDTDWNTLGNAVPAPLVARYRGARALALQGADRLQNPPPPVEPIETATHESVPMPVADTPESLASRARFDAALAAAQSQARNERERQKNLARTLEQRLPEFAAALDSGNTAEAHRLHAAIESDLKALPEIPATVQPQLAELLPRYAQLSRWQHWSNNQRRRVLCADIEALAASGLHPDAVAGRVRDAREEWQRMNANEGIDATAEAAHGISRRFHALCQHALKPTRGYFSKRKEVRRSHGEGIEALLARIGALSDDSTDWKAIATLRSEAGGALRALDGVEPQARTALAKRLKDAIARLTERGEQHEREVEAAKRRLIEQAQALSVQGDAAAAPREVRELQKRWTALGNGKRRTDQQQWNEFRAACDAVFGKLDAARKEREAQSAASREQAQQLIDAYEELAANERDPVDTIRTTLRELDARWNAAPCDDRALQQRQRRARETIELSLKDAARRQRLAQFTHAMDRYQHIRRIEAGAPESAPIEAVVVAATSPFDGALAARRERALTAAATPADASDARALLVQLEFLAGVETPAEDRQLRMNHQVQRLSSRMRQGVASTPQAELTDLLKQWFAQAPQEDALEQRFARAACAAIDALP